jgi:hypothetical protein
MFCSVLMDVIFSLYRIGLLQPSCIYSLMVSWTELYKARDMLGPLHFLALYVIASGLFHTALPGGLVQAHKLKTQDILDTKLGMPNLCMMGVSVVDFSGSRTIYKLCG